MSDFTVPPAGSSTEDGRNRRQLTTMQWVRYGFYIVTIIGLPVLAIYSRFSPIGLKLFSWMYLGMSIDSPPQDLDAAWARLVVLAGIGYLIMFISYFIMLVHNSSHDKSPRLGVVWALLMTPFVVVFGSVQLLSLMH